MKRLLLVLMLAASVASAGGYITGGAAGVSQADFDAMTHHQSWDMPTTSIANVAYMGGFYDFAGSADDFTPAGTTHGIANNSYAAHFMIVTGAVAVGEIQITVSGASITDSTPVSTGDTAVITIPDGTPANSYFETPEKWLGQVAIETTSGTAISCNYGYCKYWDNGNMDFSVSGGEALWMGDFTGETINIELIHHTDTGWTYNAGDEPDPPTPLFSMVDAHGAYVEVTSNRYGCFKRVTATPFAIEGSLSEGVLIRFTQSRAACIEYGQLTLMYTQ